MNRRDFLKVLGVSSSASMASCDPLVPVENVLPYVVTPDQIVPGISTFFASRCDGCSSNCGIVARNREGRIIKLEGNPDHPLNRGRLCARGQATLQAPYSPDRYQGPMASGQATDWDSAISTVTKAIDSARARGKQVAWLGTPKTAGTGALIDRFVGSVSGTKRMWEPLNRAELRAATRATYGIDGLPTYRIERAHTIVSFGADFLGTWGDTVPQTRGYADSRDPAVGGHTSRLVCIEPRIGSTAASADLHLAATPGTETHVALALARLVADKKGTDSAATRLLRGVNPTSLASAAGVSIDRLKQVAGWIAEAPSVILPGGTATSSAGTDLATATLLLNEVAGNIGDTVVFHGSSRNVSSESTYSEVAALLADCAQGKVGVLFLDDLDPVYALPPELGVAAALEKVDLLVAFANEPNDSLIASTLVLPPGTGLEGWGDAEAHYGWYTLQQPAMKSLANTRSLGDILLAIMPAAEDADAALPPTFREYLVAWWQTHVWPIASLSAHASNPESFWTDSLQRGGYFREMSATSASFQLGSLPASGSSAPDGDGLVLTLFPHPYVYDGRHANRPWAQEVPEPLSTYTWGTWAEIHPDAAKKYKIDADDRVTVTSPHGNITVGWFANPGIRPDTVAVVMGNGHAGGGRYARFGANPMTLLPSAVDAQSGSLKLVSTRARLTRAAGPNSKALAGSMDQDNRPINFTVKAADVGHGDGPGAIVHTHHPPIDERLKKAGLTDMFPEPEHPNYRFALSVDLNRCTGCGACQTACYAENNVAVIGPDQIRRGRHMGWIRLSRYFEGSGEQPDIRFQPVMCQQCSHAPCEGVCPVLATYHNLDGLNAMIYNRCVGTRYCANNCPYSARRFNFHTFDWPESFHLMLNPDVATRTMGVMEKCTFCVQRIRDAKDTYRDHGKTVPDAALHHLPACAQTCPADAMVFGSVKDPSSRVAHLFDNERAFSMLGELNTKPGVRYLARISHVESHGKSQGGGHH